MACTPELTSHGEKRHTFTALHETGLHHPSSPASHPFSIDLLLLITLFYSLPTRPHLLQGLPSCHFPCLESPFSVLLPGWLPVYTQFPASMSARPSLGTTQSSAPPPAALLPCFALMQHLLLSTVMLFICLLVWRLMKAGLCLVHWWC